MAINIYLSTIESKNKLSQQEQRCYSHRYGEHFDGCQMGGECGGIKKYKEEVIECNMGM